MTYVQGFLLAVPTANRQAYVDHATAAVPIFKDFGALRKVETWGDDVPVGKLNDFHGAVKREADETVLFSWIEYADRAAYDAANRKIMSDPRMAAMAEPPFDGARMVFGGFELLIDDGPSGPMGYVDGILLAVKDARKDDYIAFSRTVSPVFRDHGVTRYVETWGTDVPKGRVTDFHRAVLAEEGESVVFSWIEWPDKATRDAGMAAIRTDERMAHPPADMPLDGKRMIFGGFTPILDE